MTSSPPAPIHVSPDRLQHNDRIVDLDASDFVLSEVSMPTYPFRRDWLPVYTHLPSGLAASRTCVRVLRDYGDRCAITVHKDHEGTLLLGWSPQHVVPFRTCRVVTLVPVSPLTPCL